MEIVEVIKKNLHDIGEDYDLLKPFMQEWLCKVEEVVQRKKAAQSEAVDTLKTIDFSVKAIAAEINASRTTMYNHQQLLRRYIKTAAEKASADNPYSLITKVQTEKTGLQEQIDKLMLRDVDIELLKQENRNLAAALEGKNNEIKRLEERIMLLSSENQRLKSGKAGNGAAVKPFRKK